MRDAAVGPVTVVETPTFAAQPDKIWSDEEREAFVDFIARNPEAGAAIAETNGVRKVRWRMQSRGKRGGARVIYFFFDRNAPIYLLMVYSKSVRENLSPEEKKFVREFAARTKQALRRHR